MWAKKKKLCSLTANEFNTVKQQQLNELSFLLCTDWASVVIDRFEEEISDRNKVVG